MARKTRGHKIVPLGINLKKGLGNYITAVKDRRAKERLEEEKRSQEAEETFRYALATIGGLILITLLNVAEKIITTSSHIFPFSYLLRNNRFHYSHKPMMDTWNQLIEINRKSKTNFYVENVYEDPYFYNYIGKFEKDNSKENIETYLKMVKDKYNDNVYMQDYGHGLKTIKVIREAVTN